MGYASGPTVLPHFPFDRDTWSMHMGIRALGAGEPLFEVSPELLDELALKERLLRAGPERYVGEVEGSRAQQWEGLVLALRILARQQPQHFELTCDGATWTFTHRAKGEVTRFEEGNDASLPQAPLDWLGRQIQEDVMVLDASAPGVPLAAGSLCFPAMWSLPEKLGLSFAEIHAPVPHFADKIGRSSQLLLERLKAAHPVTRTNWGLYPTPRLDLTPDTLPSWQHLADDIDAENAGERVFLRLERQTLTRLPRTGGILFTIHTWVGPVADQLVAPERTGRLHGVLASVPEDTQRYKRLAPFRDALLTWLDRRGAAERQSDAANG